MREVLGMKKRFASITLVLVILLGMLIINPDVASASDVRVAVDGVIVQFDLPTVSVDGYLLVYIDPLAEMIGAELHWVPEVLTLTLGDKRITIDAGADYMSVNGEIVLFDVPPMDVDGYLLYPFEVIVQAFGIPLNWDGNERIVHISVNQNRETIQTPPVTVIAPTPAPLGPVPNDRIEIVLNGRLVAQNNNTGIAEVVNNRVFVPLKMLAEHMGYETRWEQDGPRWFSMRGNNQLVFHRLGDLDTRDAPVMGRVLSRTDVPSFINSQTNQIMVCVNLLPDALNVDMTVERNGAGGRVFITTPWDTTPSDGVSVAHRNAWRPTNDAFIDMAIALEVLSGTELQRGNLDGRLYTVQGVDSSGFANAGVRPGQQVSAHFLNTAPGWGLASLESIVLAVLNNTEFHDWKNANANSIGALGRLAFADVNGTEPWASDVVLATYYNILGDEFTGGTTHFRGNDNITKSEVMAMLYAYATRPTSFSGNTVESLIQSLNLPPELHNAWMLNGWSGAHFLNRWMSVEQARQIIDAPLNRLEAAVLLWRMFHVVANRQYIGDRLELLNSQEFRNQLNSAFSDINNIGIIDADREEGDWTHPLYTLEQRNGTRQIDPDDAWIALQMANLGIVPAFPDGTFRPYEPVTRGEFISMLMRAFEAQAHGNMELWGPR
jgi:hypothetical protein